MKSKEELNALKEEVEALNKKLSELTEEELEQVSGGISPGHGGAILIGTSACFVGHTGFIFNSASQGGAVYGGYGLPVSGFDGFAPADQNGTSGTNE